MRQSRTGLSLVAFVLLGACDVPTATPIYDTVWNVPGKSTSISVNSLLPANQVTAIADNSAFQVTISPASATIVRLLSQDCSACAVANGQSIAKPSFAGGGTSSLTLPTTVSGVTLVRDTLTVTITNGFNFDPLRPSAAAGASRGYLTITVRNGAAATLVGRDSIDGATTGLAGGATLVRKIPLTGTLTGSAGLQIATQLNSPIGDPVTIDASRSISVSGSTGPLFVSSAQVNLTNQGITATPTDLDLSDVDSTITNHVSAGSFLLTITNPFAVTGTANVNLTGATQITKSVPLTAGTTTPSITLTQAELRTLLGHKVTITITGSVSGNAVTVQPGQVAAVTSRLQLTINMGGGSK